MKLIWFTGGFGLGLLGISLVQAALPKRVTPSQGDANSRPSVASQIVSEIDAPKVAGPDLETDFDRLQRAEARYAESWDQQQRIRAATNQASPKKNPKRARQ